MQVLLRLRFSILLVVLPTFALTLLKSLICINVLNLRVLVLWVSFLFFFHLSNLYSDFEISMSGIDCGKTTLSGI